MNASGVIKGDGDGDYRHNMLKGLVAQASEHFDSVLVIGTCQGLGDETHMQYASTGNHYASVAAAERWVAKNKREWICPPSD